MWFSLGPPRHLQELVSMSHAAQVMQVLWMQIDWAFSFAYCLSKAFLFLFTFYLSKKPKHSKATNLWGERKEHLQQVEPKLDRDATLHQMDIIVHYQLLPDMGFFVGREPDWFQVGVRRSPTWIVRSLVIRLGWMEN